MTTETNYPDLAGKTILIVEDDRSMLERLTLNLEQLGCIVTQARDVSGAERCLSDCNQPFDLAIVDMYIPEDEKHPIDRVMRGEQFAYTIRKRSPGTRIVGMSAHMQRVPFTPLSDLFSGFIYKDDLPASKPPVILFETVDGILASRSRRKPKVFIVHGHDNEALLELKDYLQNTLDYGLPTVLREKPSCGKTIIEKFEQEARDVDLVFVLLTPDDETRVTPRETARRARQNVVFEMGFFYAKLQRTSGRIFLLCKGGLEIPSDISGVIYIDISKGIKFASDEIRSELRGLGW
jgi:CheY-like chemotaxis protein